MSTQTPPAQQGQLANAGRSSQILALRPLPGGSTTNTLTFTFSGLVSTFSAALSYSADDGITWLVLPATYNTLGTYTYLGIVGYLYRIKLLTINNGIVNYVLSHQNLLDYSEFATDPFSKALAVFGNSPAGIATSGGALAQSPRAIYGQIAHRAPTFAAKLANVIAGTGGCKVACLGDSTTAGQGSIVSDGISGAYAYAWPAYLSKLFSATGIPATIASKWNDNGNVSQGTTVPVYDPRVTVGSGWTYNTSFESIGGSLLGCASTGTWSFTPVEQWDKVDIYYLTSSGGGTISANIDGGAGTTINTNTTAGRAKITVTAGSVGTHTVNLVGVSGGVYVFGVECYNSTTPQVRLFNMGRRSGTLTSADVSTATYSPVPALKTIAPDMTIIMLGANDAHYALDPATSATALSDLVAAGRVSGDVVFVTFLPGASSFATLPAQTAMYTSLVTIANSLNVPIIDINAYRVVYNSPQAIGNSFYYDTIHQTKSGYADVARMIKAGLDAF